MNKKILFGLLIVVLFGLRGIWDLHIPYLYTCHDAESHVVRLLQYERTLHDGQFPAQWAKTLYGGIGSPVLMLNYQLPYYLAMTLRSLGFTIFNSFKLVMAISFLGSGVFAYLVFRKITSWQIATVAAVLYMWTPYHFLDLYVRCAFGEMVGFMFIPIIILGMMERSYLWLIAGWAGLFLSHPVMSAGLSPLLLGWVIIRHLDQKNWIAIRENMLAYLLAIGIAAFNILPTLSLTRYTQYSPNNSDTYEHFVTVKQLVINHWGYGFSMPEDHDQMSFAIGYINLFILAIVAGYLLYRRDWRHDKSAWYMIVCLGITFIFTHQISKPLYQLFNLSNFIDYPWRLLMIQVVGTPILLLWLGSKLPTKYLTTIMYILLVLIWYTNRNHVHINATWPFDINYYVKTSGSGDAFGEYASTYRYTHRMGRVTERLQFIQGNGDIDYIVDKTQELVAKVDVNSEHAVVRYNIMHFPGWNYRIDGYEMQLDNEQCGLSNASLNEDDQDYSGLVECKLDKGTHRMIARWITPPPVEIGNMISLGSLGAYVWLILKTKRTTKKLALKNGL